MANMNSFVADELSHKVKILHSALNQANDIIDSLKIENKRLYDALSGLASINKEDYNYGREIVDESIVSV